MIRNTRQNPDMAAMASILSTENIMGMIDFHTHILPGIDDGSQSMNESIEMLRSCSEQRVTSVVLTPHLYLYNTDPQTFLRKRDRAFAELLLALQKESPAKDTHWPKLILGAEVYFIPELSDLADLKSLCIGKSNYLMVELPNEGWSAQVNSTLERLINNGILPIIAHIERYLPQMNVTAKEQLHSLVEHGTLTQVNVSYLTAFRTRWAAIKQLKAGQIHLIGSDCHNRKKRSPNMASGFDAIKKYAGWELVESLMHDGETILQSFIKND